MMTAVCARKSAEQARRCRRADVRVSVLALALGRRGRFVGRRFGLLVGNPRVVTDETEVMRLASLEGNGREELARRRVALRTRHALRPIAERHGDPPGNPLSLAY